MSSEPQQTLARSASVSGTSLHTGEKVTLKLQPAPVDFGLKFRRKDLQEEPTIDATIANLKTVERATTIGEALFLRLNCLRTSANFGSDPWKKPGARCYDHAGGLVMQRPAYGIL